MIIERALIVQDIWLNMIFAGDKAWEMRSTKTNVRGLIGLIGSGSGLIKGCVEITDSIDPLGLETYDQYYPMHRIPKEQPIIQRKYRYPWVLNNAKRFKKPIPYTHPQGAVIWVKLNENIAKAI